MTKEKAIKLYLSKSSKRLAGVVHNLMVWDESKTMDENCEVLGISRQAGVSYKHKYGLKTVRKETFKRNQRLNGMVKMRKLGFTLAFIAKAFSTSRQNVFKIIKKANSK